MRSGKPRLFPWRSGPAALMFVGVLAGAMAGLDVAAGQESHPAGAKAPVVERTVETSPPDALSSLISMDPSSTPPKEALIALDFNNVDLPVFVKFISELTSKNFVIDDRVRGKVTILSPTKMTVEKAYKIFLSILDLKGMMAVPIGEAIQILPRSEVPTDRAVNIYTVQNTTSEEMQRVLGGFIRGASGARPALLPVADFEGPVQLIADKSTNMLVIIASARDYEMIHSLLKKLDIRKKQVYVEAVIMEVTMERARTLGVDLGAAFLYKGGDLAVIGGINAAPEDLARSVAPIAQAIPGAVSIAALNVRAALQALQTDAEVNILSTPQLLTADQQKAEIIVGETRPFPAGQSITSGGVVQTGIERRDVGITLRLTPQILENDQVKMEIYQEISAVNEGVGSSVGTVVVGPTTTKRSANTTVIVQDQETVVIAGLIKDDIVRSEKKVPLLGDIPILGWLFKTQSKRTEKRNLLVFLTPTIIKEPVALSELRRTKGQQVLDFMEKHKSQDRETRRPFLEAPVNLPRPPQGLSQNPPANPSQGP